MPDLHLPKPKLERKKGMSTEARQQRREKGKPQKGEQSFIGAYIEDKRRD